MSVKVNVRARNQSITELLKGIVNWLEISNEKQRFVLILDLKPAKKDC